MMAHKQLLHELLKEDQEPFQLQRYIAYRRCQLKKPSASTSLHLSKRKESRSNFARHVCFFSFQNSPDIRKSPFRDFPMSPAKSPCKSPKGAVFLHIPSGTAAHLVEAAMRIQKQHQPKPKSQNPGLGIGLFGSFLKRLKDRSRNKKRAIESNDFKVSRKNATKREHPTEEEAVRISSCSNRRLSSADWTDNNDDKSMDFEASTSGYGSDCSEDIISDFDFSEHRFCSSPFVFSFHKSPLSNGCRTPDFCSPVGSPSRRSKSEIENYQSQNLVEALGQEDEEKEQCSPVSVLDPPFEDDDGRESGDVQVDDFDLECSYANVQRAKEQLLHRLRRFEKLADLDPLELEKKLLEGSDDELGGSDDDSEELTSIQFNLVGCRSTNMSNEIVEDIIETFSNKDAVTGQLCTGLDPGKGAGFNMIEMMIRLDLSKECKDGWRKPPEQVGDTAVDVELAVFELLVEELLDELN